MQTVDVVLFSDYRETVLDATTEIKSLCETKGIEYGGPYSLPTLKLSDQEADLADQGVSLFGEVPNEREIEQLKGKTVFSRQFRFNRYSSDEVTKEIVRKEYPEGLFLRVNVRQTDFVGADQGCVPFSYDPNVDYSTEP